MFQQAEDIKINGILKTYHFFLGNSTKSVEESPGTGSLQGRDSAALFIAVSFLHML